MNIHCAASLLPLYALVQWFSSVHFSHSVMFNALRPHELQHTRLPSPLPTIRACSNSCPSSWWSIQSSHPLSSPSLAFSLSQHQGLFQWVSSSDKMAKVLELQHWSFQLIFRVDFLSDWLVCAVQETLKNLLQHQSWKHQFFGTQPALLSNIWKQPSVHQQIDE